MRPLHAITKTQQSTKWCFRATTGLPKSSVLDPLTFLPVSNNIGYTSGYDFCVAKAFGKIIVGVTYTENVNGSQYLRAGLFSSTNGVNFSLLADVTPPQIINPITGFIKWATIFAYGALLDDSKSSSIFLMPLEIETNNSAFAGIIVGDSENNLNLLSTTFPYKNNYAFGNGVCFVGATTTYKTVDFVSFSTVANLASNRIFYQGQFLAVLADGTSTLKRQTTYDGSSISSSNISVSGLLGTFTASSQTRYGINVADQRAFFPIFQTYQGVQKIRVITTTNGSDFELTNLVFDVSGFPGLTVSKYAGVFYLSVLDQVYISSDGKTWVIDPDTVFFEGFRHDLVDITSAAGRYRYFRDTTTGESQLDTYVLT